MGRNQPAPIAMPESVVAVCLDTNCMGEGRVRVAAVEELSDLIGDQDLSIEIWIPEPVIWEWAEHLYSEFAEARSKYMAAWEILGHSGFEVPPKLGVSDPTDVAAVVSQLTDSLEEIGRVHVLSLNAHPAISRAALRDQTLQLGVGRRKASVKAGAADSAAFRLLDAALAAVPGETSIAVVSGDQDAETYFGGREDVVVFPSLWATKRSVVTMRTGSEIAGDQVKEAVRDALPGLSQHQLQDVAVTGAPDLEPGERSRGREVSVVLSVLEIEKVVAIEWVDVSFSDGYGIALVDAHVVVQRELQVLSAFNDELVYDVETFSGIPATLQVSAMHGSGTYWSIQVERVELH